MINVSLGAPSLDPFVRFRTKSPISRQWPAERVDIRNINAVRRRPCEARFLPIETLTWNFTAAIPQPELVFEKVELELADC